MNTEQTSANTTISATQRGTFKIGAVARIAGVSTHTIRKWEERYSAVEPRRSPGGERIYTRTDLERLVMIKRLADAGLSLAEIAPLPLEELAAARQEMVDVGREQPETRATPAQVRVAVLGTSLQTTLGRGGQTPDLLEVIAAEPDPASLAARLDGKTVDVLVVDCPTIRRDTRRTITDLARRLEVRGTVVLYRFAARGDVLSIQSPSIITMRAPADGRALQQAALGILRPAERTLGHGTWVATGQSGEVPPPRLSPEVMTRVAQSSPRMRCECPHHLADLILSLRAFEEYSADCESRNDEDAELHHFLWRSAAQARSLFEDAIERVAAVEGIDLRS